MHMGFLPILDLVDVMQIVYYSISTFDPFLSLKWTSSSFQSKSTQKGHCVKDSIFIKVIYVKKNPHKHLIQYCVIMMN